jgi:hypothetical protein
MAVRDVWRVPWQGRPGKPSIPARGGRGGSDDTTQALADDELPRPSVKTNNQFGSAAPEKECILTATLTGSGEVD